MFPGKLGSFPANWGLSRRPGGIQQVCLLLFVSRWLTRAMWAGKGKPPNPSEACRETPQFGHATGQMCSTCILATIYSIWPLLTCILATIYSTWAMSTCILACIYNTWAMPTWILATIYSTWAIPTVYSF